MNMQRTSLFLMANLGAEVSRILSLKEKHEYTLANDALNRARKIIQEIKAQSDMRSRIKELDVLSVVIENILNSESTVKVSPKNIKSYFVPFSLRLMANKAN